MENTKNPGTSLLNLRTLFKLVVSFLFTIILFYFLLKYVSLNEIIKNIKQTSFSIIIVSCLLLLLNYLFRTLRLHILLSKKIPFPHLYYITTIHNTFIQLLPFRLGEFSFFYFTSKTKKVDIMDAGIALVSARFFDIMIVISSFFVSFFFLDNTISLPIPRLLILFILFIILMGTLFILHAKKTQAILILLLSKRQEKKTLLTSLLIKGDQVLTHLHSFNSKKSLFFLVFFSLCIWTSYYALMYFLYLSSGISFGYMNFLFIVSTALLFALIPIQGIAGFGNVEISWSALLILFGIESTLALKTTVLVHVIGIIATLILGLVGLLLFSFRKKTED